MASILAALLHVAIMIGGADWYRFFGAGEGMAQLSENGSTYPAIITIIITMTLTSWGLYGFSGAGLIIKLPLLKSVLIIISMIYILRGILGIPLVMLVDNPYLNELESKVVFVVFSSVISLTLGFLYLIGTLRMKPTLR